MATHFLDDPVQSATGHEALSSLTRAVERYPNHTRRISVVGEARDPKSYFAAALGELIDSSVHNRV